MALACTFAFFGLIATIVSCNANPLLIARQPSFPCLNYRCPASDTGFYPLAPDLSGPMTGGGAPFIHCFYPFFFNCKYFLSTGVLAADNDGRYCPQAHVQQNCTGNACPYACPAYDNANYPLGIGSGPQGNILFCTYPTSEQPNVAVLYCNYNQANGELLFDNDEGLCPQIATPSNASTTPYCPSHSGVVGPTTVTPLTSHTSSISTPTTSNTAQHGLSRVIAGATAGGVVGSLFVLALASYLLCYRHRRHAGPAEFSTEARHKMYNPKSERLVHPVDQYHLSPNAHDGTGHLHTAEGMSHIPDNANRVAYNASGVEVPYSGLPEPASVFDPNELITEVARRPDVRPQPITQNSIPLVSGSSTIPGNPLVSGIGSISTSAKASDTVFPPINNDPPPREETLPPLPPAHGSTDDTDLRPQLEALRAEVEMLRAQQAHVLQALPPPQYSNWSTKSTPE